MSEAQSENQQASAPVCYWHRFLSDPCQTPATWKGRGAFNYTDDWTWCDEHVTKIEEFREKLP